MKKIILLSVLIFYAAVCFAQMASVKMGKVRKLYQKSERNEKSCKKMIKLLATFNAQNNPLLLGYKASATMMMASYTWNPYKKLSYFKKGKHMLAKAIKAKRKNVELRFLRLAAQVKAPSFLGYDECIKSDEKFLRNALPKIESVNLKIFIVKQLEHLNISYK